jgi:LysM repeat protein
MNFRLAFPRRPLQRVTLKKATFKRGLSLAMAAIVLLSGGLAVAIPTQTTASAVDVLSNGSFEHGFVSQQGCGLVGYGWNCFTNGGAAGYGFYDDQWEPVVADGEHSQLIEINTKGMTAADDDRYAGIYQTVRVVDWENYTLHVRGMIRTTVQDGDPWRYRVEVGWTPGRKADWRAVTNWADAGWDTYYDRLAPGNFSDYSARLMAEDDFVTIYIRVWKKWGVPEEEIDVNFDAITLTGPSPYGDMPEQWAQPMAKDEMMAPQPPMGGPMMEKPMQPMQPMQPMWPMEPPQGELACGMGEYVYNGGFEDGFNPVYAGEVGRSWGFFTNGGAAGYGFYDEQWPPVVASGDHGQLIELNTKGVLEGDNDRYAGIYQHIRGLKPGKTYELSLRGMLRGVGGGDDPYRYEAQWGYNAGADGDWTHVDNWQGMDLGDIYPRTEPESMGAYSVQFVAPAPEMTLFLRGWMKWGVSESEFDLNLDDVSLSGCGYVKPMPPMQPGRPMPPMQPEQPMVCTYTVQPGDMLSVIAAKYGVTVGDMMKVNGISDPNLIYVGQVLQIPGCGQSMQPKPMGQQGMMMEQPMGQQGMMMEPPMGQQGMMMEPPMGQQGMMMEQPMGQQGMPARPPARPAPMSQQQVHVVRPGDTFSAICQRYGADQGQVAAMNGIANPNIIVVGQEIVIP